MAESHARISRVHNSWRVRVYGYRPQFFADSEYGGTESALWAARKWRDAHWDGKDRNRKLSAAERSAIKRSKKHYRIIAEQYGIHPNYVHQLRAGRR